MNKDLKLSILEILSQQTDMTVATNRPDGYPQATTVSYVSDGLDIYFATGPASQKARNIEKDPRVSVAVTPAYTDWNAIRGLSIIGRAHKVTERDETSRLAALFFAKFPSVAQYAPQDRTALAMFRIVPEFISVLDYTRGFGHTDLVDVRAG